MLELEKTFDILLNIYNQHRKKYSGNSIDSQQMCLMWSTREPPDQIENTEPFNDIEEAFDIEIGETESFELYEMTLEQASIRVLELQGIL